MKFDYSLTSGDYRAALYFATALRLQKALRIAAVVCGTSVVMLMGSYINLLPAYRAPIYALIGYLVWVVYLVAATEASILKYMKHKDCILGKNISVSVTDEGLFSLLLEGEPEPIRLPMKNLFLVFEQSTLFNIYISEQKTCLLPKRAMTESQVTQLRTAFSRKLKDRFSSRFGENTPKKRSFLFPFR